MGNSEIVKLLCAAGAGLEGTDGVGFTALITAVADQHLDITEVFLEHGADPETEVCGYRETGGGGGGGGRGVVVVVARSCCGR